MILGESFRIAERYDDSIREYKQATAEQPQLAAAWSGLAASYSAQGDDSNAQKAAARANKLDPNDPDTNALIAAIYLRQGNAAQAETFAVQALRANTNLAGAHVVLAKIYLARKQPKKALPELQLAAKDDIDGSTYYLLATTFRELGRPNEAAAAIQKYKRLHSARVGSIPRER
jgi:tetratricopeptide (TPR) repeat protein